MDDFSGIKPGTLERFAHTDYEPKDPAIRAKLRLPLYAPAPVCPVCGIVHVDKCPVVYVVRREKRPRRQPTRWADYPVNLLRWAIENREEII